MLTAGLDRIGSARGPLSDRVGPRFSGIADGLCLGLRRRCDRILYVRIIEVTFAEIVYHIIRQEQRNRHVAGLKGGPAELLKTGGRVAGVETGENPYCPLACPDMDVPPRLVLIQVGGQPAACQSARDGRI